jgi:small subunit ribosomal protein S9
VSEIEPQPLEPKIEPPAAEADVTPDAPPAPEAVVVPSGEAAVPSEASQAAPGRSSPAGVHVATGRRKTAVARVRIRSGSGKMVINRRELEQYFTQLKDREAVTAPLKLTGSGTRWDVSVRVRGGGPSGQSGAILLGVARALVKADPAQETTLRDAGLLTRDARKVERKKYGHKKARRSFQFSKR